MQGNVDSIDCELVLKSMIFMADGVASIIGDNGARAVMRQAGHRAAVNLLEALPLHVPVTEAITRACPVMAALGFVSDVCPEGENRIVVRGNLITQTLADLQLTPDRHPARYYVFGLFEGLVYVLSKSRIAVVQHQTLDDRETWTLQL